MESNGNNNYISENKLTTNIYKYKIYKNVKITMAKITK